MDAYTYTKTTKQIREGLLDKLNMEQQPLPPEHKSNEGLSGTGTARS